MDSEFYKNLINKASFGYAYHKIILDDSGTPIDYEFLDVNSEFEQLTGLKQSKILNKKVSVVIPGIENDDFDWISFYGKIALGGKPKDFEQYSELLDKHYKVHAYSTKKLFFITIFTDITPEIKIVDTAKNFIDDSFLNKDYRKLTDNLLSISGAKYILFNLYKENSTKFTSVALSGVNKHFDKVTKIFGFDPEGRVWEQDTIIEEKISHSLMTFFPDMHELCDSILSKRVVTLLQKSFGIGKLIVVKIMKKEKIFGAFVLMMGKNKELKNKALVEIYAQQVALFLEKDQAKKEIAREKQQLQIVFDEMPDAINQQKLDHTIISYNKAACALVGKTMDESIGKKCFELIGRNTACEICATERAIKSKKTEDLEKEIPELGIWVHATSIPIFDKEGNISGIIEKLQEITERKQAEFKILESEKKFRNLFESTSDAALLISDGIIIDCNTAAIKTFKCNVKNDLLGKHPAIISPEKQANGEDSLKLADQKMAEAIEKGSAFFEWIHQRLDGEDFTTEILLNPFKLGEKNIIQAVIRDITKRKQAERKLVQSEKMYRSIIENMTDVYYRTNNDGKLVMISPSAAKLFGVLTTEELLGLDISNDFYVHPEERSVFLETLKDNHGRITNYEIDLKRKNGEIVTVITSSAYFFDLDGNIAGIEGVFSDITERKKREIELKKTNKKLAQQTAIATKMVSIAETANRAKSDFLANMSHEIRTPMNAVVGFTELLLSTELDDTQREYLNHIHTSADTLLLLINDLLDFSKIEAGQLEIASEDINLRNLLEKSIDLVTFNAHKKELTLLLNIDCKLPLIVKTDQVRLSQIIINLLSNAVKFTEKGEVELKVTVEDNQTINFSIRDTGIGITKKQQATIFQPFTQADQSTTRKYGGTGLGLSISKQLIEKMGGKLTVKSELEQGSTFSFSLKLDFKPNSWPIESTNFNLRNVLIVEANVRRQKIIQNMLSFWNIPFTTINNGEEAIKLLDDGKHFDFILMNYNLPNLNGLEIAKIIKQKLEPTGKLQPLAIMHSYTQKKTFFDECQKLNINYKIKKPLKMNALRNILINNQNQVTTIPMTNTIPQAIIHSNNIKILVVDNSPTNKILVIRLLNKMFSNIEILEAADGKQAINVYNENDIDLILMDIQMPILNGYEATIAIRKLEGDNKHTPIIALTAGVTTNDIKKCLAAGMDDYLAKPIKLKLLQKVINHWTISQKMETPTIKQNETITQKKSTIQNTLSEIRKYLINQGLDDEDINEILELLLEQLPTMIAEIKNYFMNKNENKIRTSIHTSKGMFSNLGAKDIAFKAVNIEKTFDEDNPTKAWELVEKLLIDFSDILEYLKIWEDDNQM